MLANDLALEANFRRDRNEHSDQTNAEGRCVLTSEIASLRYRAQLAVSRGWHVRSCPRRKSPGSSAAVAGLTTADINDASRRLEVKAQIKVLELAAEAVGDDLLDFIWRDFELGEIGLPYYVMASSESLAEALATPSATAQLPMKAFA